MTRRQPHRKTIIFIYKKSQKKEPLRLFESECHSGGKLFVSDLNGGPKIPGRKLSSFSSPSRHVIDMIDFIYELEWKDKTFLTQKYINEGRSIAQIANETLSSKSAIREALIEFDIKRKPQGKPGLRPSQPPYGYRLSHGLMVPHLGEQRVIASVKKMIDGGVTYRKTCEFLTSVGVPTKKKGKSWQPEMIRRLLSR